MKPKIYSAEVIKTEFAYQDGTSSIIVRFQSTSGMGGLYQTTTAFPVDLYSYTIPLIGEHVILYKSISAGTTNSNQGNTTYYYGNVIPARIQLLQNSVIGTTSKSIRNNTRKSDSYQQKSGTPDRNTLEEPKLGETFTDSSKPQLPTQPFEGDYLIQGRYGQSIRLGSSFKGGGTLYDQLPEYKGPSNSPIMILRTPALTEKNKTYSIESLNDDASSIYLTSNQKVFGFKPSQNNLGKNSKGSANRYTSPQVIISSDRLIFNAKNDSVFIIGKNNVNIVTNKWAMQMDNFFTVMDEFLTLMSKSATGDTAYQYVTGVGPTVGNPGLALRFQKLAQQLNLMRQ